MPAKQLTLQFPLVYKEALIAPRYFREESGEFRKGLEKLLGVKLTLKAKKNTAYGNPVVGDWIIDLKE